jgi:hypothetical protein
MAVGLALVALLAGIAESGTRRSVRSSPTECRAEVLGPEPYEQRIAATRTHCALPFERCGEVHEKSVAYRWPAEDDSRTVRTALLLSVKSLFTAPVADPPVHRLAGWLYEPGRWHMAADYGIDGAQSFDARAAAPGRVIDAGWDGFSGNTVVVSHEAGAEPDAYRTIFMHLRNGARHDCAASWAESAKQAPQGSPMLAAYKARLERTGCGAKAADRRPDPRFWGSEGDVMDASLLGRSVKAGDLLGRAGDTGPGGFATAENPNVHLHVFFARRDARDGAWILFDPWGVYGIPSCYPPGTPKGRSLQGFPSAWK